MIAPDYQLITTPDLTRKIYYHLTSKDLNNCALVNKAWHASVRDARKMRSIIISAGLLRQIYANKSNLDNYLTERVYSPNVIINGWAPKDSVTEQTYNSLLKARLKAKNLTFNGRGSWISCRCPRKTSSCGELIDSIANDDIITNLETITVTSTFKISACALLDLVSRSPNLKVLRFFGVLEKSDHTELFNFKRFLSDLDCLIWPRVQKTHCSTLTILVKRNENITTFYSNGEVTCDLLATDALNNLKYLSLILDEKWIDNEADDSQIKKYSRRAQRFTDKIKYLGLGKKIEGLEVRTYDAFMVDDDNEEDKARELRTPNLLLKLEPMYEHYKLLFWEQVVKLTNLKFLAVHGAWEMNEVCRELAKHEAKIEFLRLSLIPKSLQLALQENEDSPSLSMEDEARNLKKLPKLRSLWLSCFEKLGSIDEKTAHSLRDLMDLIWAMDTKVMFTEEVESLLNIMMRRGKQLGKMYKITLHVQCKEAHIANFLVDLNLRFPMGTDLKLRLTQIAEEELDERKGSFESFHIWGLQQIDNTRDRQTFEQLKRSWMHYDGIFNNTSPWFKFC